MFNSVVRYEKLPMQLYGIIFTCMLIISDAQKHVVFTRVQCNWKSNKVANVKCYLEPNNTFTIAVTVGKDDVGNLVGISELNLYTYGQKRVTKIDGVRLDICKMLDGKMRPSMLSFLYNGIQQADNNLPERCPFKRNVTYILQHMQFDVNSLPMFIPEYNFTFSGKFFGSNVNLFEVRVKGSYCLINKDCTGAGGNQTGAN